MWQPASCPPLQTCPAAISAWAQSRPGPSAIALQHRRWRALASPEVLAQALQQSLHEIMLAPATLQLFAGVHKEGAQACIIEPQKKERGLACTASDSLILNCSNNSILRSTYAFKASGPSTGSAVA